MELAVKRFIKKDESFTCEYCNAKVSQSSEGSCRNHCPRCLYSKHLDINPGDRLAKCGGLMEPVDIDQRSGNFRILHKCLKCGYERWNKIASEDDLIGYYEKKNS